MLKTKIPNTPLSILDTLNENGYSAFLIGGCIRDLLMMKTPKDYDIATSAKPEEVIQLFKTVIPTGLKHGTVTVMIDNVGYEVTTYRTDGDYSDNRKPDSVEFTDKIETDLARRDFTMNAIAYNPKLGIIDPFNGQSDIKNKIIRAVGNAEDRLKEDALRIARAVRFQYQLGFNVTEELQYSCFVLKNSLNNVSKERIREELNKILLSDYIYESFELDTMIEVIIPELGKTIGFNQNNPYHNLDLWNHSLKATNLIDNKLHLKLAALLHDIGKIKCQTTDNKGISHYYNHPSESKIIAEKILIDLKYDNKTKDKVLKLILAHDQRLGSKKSVRKMLSKLGVDLTKDLLILQYADILAQNEKYAFDRLISLFKAYNFIEEIVAEKECFTLKDLSINGKDLIEFGIKPGVEMGRILNGLLDKVINEEVVNTKESLLKEVKDNIL